MAKLCGATQPGADRFSYPYPFLAKHHAIYRRSVWLYHSFSLKRGRELPKGFEQHFGQFINQGGLKWHK